jgi:hypothetical protein
LSIWLKSTKLSYFFNSCICKFLCILGHQGSLLSKLVYFLLYLKQGFIIVDCISVVGWYSRLNLTHEVLPTCYTALMAGSCVFISLWYF